MSSVDSSSTSTTGSAPVKAGDLRLEVVVVPVSDVDGAKSFYETLGWRPDADLAVDDGYRDVPLTPPGCACSIIFGTGLTTAPPGSFEGSQLSVFDINEACTDLIGRGVDVSETFHDVTGIFPPRRDRGTPERSGAGPCRFGSFAAFSDPDGNGWLLQEIKTRLPGR